MKSDDLKKCLDAFKALETYLLGLVPAGEEPKGDLHNALTKLKDTKHWATSYVNKAIVEALESSAEEVVAEPKKKK